MILIPFDQLFDLPEKEQPFVLEWLAQEGIRHDGKTMSVDMELIKEKFYKCSGLTIELSPDRKVSFEAYANLLDNRSVPVTTAWDHDLLLHVLPIIRSGIDFTNVFKNIDSVKDIRCKIFAFETMFLIAYDMLTAPGRHIDRSVDQLVAFGVSKARQNATRDNEIHLFDYEFPEIQSLMEKAAEEIKRQGKSVLATKS